MRPSDRARLMLLVSVVVTVVLYQVPAGRYLVIPLMLLSTLAHELGHGVTAILVGGSFERFEMWSDGSGVAVWGGSGGRLELALVAAGGLVGPALVAALAFSIGRTARGARGGLLVAALFLALALVLVVRNVFGGFFVLAIFVLCLGVGLRASDEVAQLVLVFLAVQLALSVFSRGDYLFTREAETAQGTMLSDVGQMASALFLPYWFWGAVCGLFSVVVLVLGLRTYWR